ncbi:MAG: S9 family peptidase [candidate division Zixibacteria bacterium]|nr:S9 family peptidase [candidate division Zixibacteria bacterium]
MHTARKTVGIWLVPCLMLTAVLAHGQESKRPTTVLDSKNSIPDIATFLQIGGATTADYSWDGKDVYFQSSMSGAPQIYLLNEQGWPSQLTTFEDGVVFFFLSHDATMAVVGADIGGNENAQLYLMDIKTARLVRLTEDNSIRYGNTVWANDDKSFFYRSNEENKKDFFIYRLDITTGKSVKVFGDSLKTPGSNSVEDMSPDGNFLLVSTYTSNVNCDLSYVDLRSGGYQQITRDSTEVLYGSPELMPDNKTVMLTCNDNPEGISSLADLNIATSAITFMNDGWISPLWDIKSLSVSRDFKYIAALVNEDGYTRIKLRDLKSKKEIAPPPLDGIISGGKFDKNGGILFSFDGATRASDVWRWVPATKKLEQLTFSIYAGIDRELFSDPQLVRYKSFDGLEIPAFLYLPKSHTKGNPVPFMVYAHGGPESQFTPNFSRNFQYMLLNGYGILAVNPRGSSGYGRTYLSLDNYKDRKNSLKDYKAGIDWLVNEGYSKSGMIGIQGGSYGGYVVLGMITEYPDLLSSAICAVGIANFETFLKNTASYRRKLREAEYGPLTDSMFLREISPIHKASLIKTPLLVVHGENDPRVPVDEARQILQAISSRGGIVDSLIFADEGHGSAKRSNLIIQYRKYISFMDTYLKGLAVKTETH